MYFVDQPKPGLSRAFQLARGDVFARIDAITQMRWGHIWGYVRFAVSAEAIFRAAWWRSYECLLPPVVKKARYAKRSGLCFFRSG